jgi:hypothetical protein
MTETAVHFLVSATLAFILYALVARGLFRATEEMRCSLIEIAETLLSDDGMPSDEKEAINQALSEVHSAAAARQMAAALFYVVLFPDKRLRDQARAEMNLVPKHLQHTFDAFQKRWVIATLGNSPISSAAVVLLIIVRFIFVSSMLPISHMLLKHKHPNNEKHA